MLSLRLLVVVVLAATTATHATHSTASSLNFLAIGDWGGASDSDPTTSAEIAAAAGMGKIASELNASFVLALGDNFYSSGIHGSDHCSRFQTTFEDVYKQDSLQVPWYVIAGNHDHLGNVTAQIEYTTLSKRWEYPAPYYTVKKSFEVEGGVKTFELLMIDTVILSGNSDLLDNKFDPLPGPANVQLAETQWEWIESTLAASTADYLWVGGHYPVWSACSHGPTDTLISRLRPMLLKYNVTGYTCGHDHCLEYIDDGGQAKYVLTGSGKMCCYIQTNTDKCPKDSVKFIVAGTESGMQSGFASFRLTKKSMKVVYHDQDGKELFSTPDMLPRH